MKRALKTVVALSGMVFFAIGLYALMTITDKVTAALVTSLGIILLGLCFLPGMRIYDKNWIRRGHRILTIVLLCGFIVCVFISSFMVFGVNSYKGEDFDGTVIVLGTKINGSHPSQMLKARLDRATDFLKQNPESVCIVSGGQGKDEPYAEAKVMEEYLVKKGIDNYRIFREDMSKNTQQNIEYSRDLVQKNKLSSEVVVITNYFHRYRAQLFADNAGLDSYSVYGNCRLDLEILYWFREMAAVVKTWIIIE